MDYDLVELAGLEDFEDPPCPWAGYHQPGECEECDEHHGPEAVEAYAWKLDERWA